MIFVRSSKLYSLPLYTHFSLIPRARIQFFSTIANKQASFQRVNRALAGGMIQFGNIRFASIASKKAIKSNEIAKKERANNEVIKELVYEIPFERQIRGYNRMTLAVLASNIITIPLICYNLDFYIGSSMAAALATLIPISFIRIWTRNLVKNIWLTNENSGNSSFSQDIEELIYGQGSENTKKQAPKQLKSYEKFLAKNENEPIFLISSYRLLGKPETIRVSLSQIHPETLPSDKNQLISSMIKWILKPQDNAEGRPKIKPKNVFIFRDSVNANPFLKAMAKKVNFKGSNRPKNPENELIDFKM